MASVPNKPERSESRGPDLPARIEIVPWDQGAARANAVARGVGLGLGSAFAAALVVAQTPLVGGILSWVAVSFAGAIGVKPLISHRLATKRSRQVSVWGMDPVWAAAVVKGAEQSNRLRDLAIRTPDGPVSDHISFLAHRADDYVMALHAAGPPARPGTIQTELRREAETIVAELAELVVAAERLRDAQRNHLEQSPINDLINETKHLTDAIEAHDLPVLPDDN